LGSNTIGLESENHKSHLERSNWVRRKWDKKRKWGVKVPYVDLFEEGISEVRELILLTGGRGRNDNAPVRKQTGHGGKTGAWQSLPHVGREKNSGETEELQPPCIWRGNNGLPLTA